MSVKKTKNNTLFLEKILKEINNKLKLKKQENIPINDIGDLVSAKKNHLTFCSTHKYINFLIKTKASAVIVQKNLLNMYQKKLLP